MYFSGILWETQHHSIRIGGLNEVIWEFMKKTEEKEINWIIAANDTV